MNRDLDYLHYSLFRLKIHEAKGQAWEDIFVAVMEQDDPNFTKIKANQGDGGNDGYKRDDGTYYACYGPDDSSSERTKKEVCAKAKRDLLKLKKNWNGTVPVKKYHPVFNDRFDGITQELERLMVSLQSEHGLEEATVFSAKHLIDKFMGLSHEKRERVIGCIPNPASLVDTSVDYSSLDRVVQYVLRNRKTIPILGHLETPEFEEKIRFNNLSRPVANLLRIFSNDANSVTDFFQKNSDWSKQDLRNEFALFYAEEKNKYSQGSVSDEGLENALVFHSIMGRATPKLSMAATDAERRSVQEAVLTLMAFYFEACDIFEPPTSMEN